MLSTCKDFQLCQHVAANFVLWQHPTNGVTHDLLRLAIQAVLSGFFAKASVAGVPSVNLLVQLVAAELNLVTVGNDDEIARIDVRCVGWAVLAHQYHCDIRCDAADDLVFAVNDPPLFS